MMFDIVPSRFAVIEKTKESKNEGMFKENTRSWLKSELHWC